MTWQRFTLTRQPCQRFVKEGVDLPADRPLVDPAPPWRRFMGWEEYRSEHAADALERWKRLREIKSERAREKADSFILPETKQCRELVLAVNAALALRRPLLVTGQPGSGKTTLAYVLADWLALGPVLEWPVSPGGLLADALATYNPLARLQDLEMAKTEGREPLPVERFVRLGPVGTAFLPAPLPRVLLIDEIDKGDLNLANELLHLFEEGRFPIPELQRAERDQQAKQRNQKAREQGPEAAQQGSEATEHAAEAADQNQPAAEPGQPQPARKGRLVDTWDEDDDQPLQARIFGGQVRCHEFPLVVMSSNGERDFPPAFNRRCLRVTMPDFSRQPEALKRIVARHLERDGSGATRDVEAALAIFTRAVGEQQSLGDVLATDQLLNLAFLMDDHLAKESRGSLAKVLLQGLNSDLASDEARASGDAGGDGDSDGGG